jgi:hypothetical protein
MMMTSYATAKPKAMSVARTANTLAPTRSFRAVVQGTRGTSFGTPRGGRKRTANWISQARCRAAKYSTTVLAYSNKDGDHQCSMLGMMLYVAVVLLANRMKVR